MIDDSSWLFGQIEGLTDQKVKISVSDWAENNRYLPAQVTSMPGYYSYDVAPYLREIADCFSIDSQIREIDVMKGAQIGATVGVLENIIGYVIDHVKSAPVMLLTADAELAKIRVDSYITPMLQHSGLDHLIRSSDEFNARKTGKTKQRLEWAGGGFLVPFGAKNADKLRSISIQYLLQDEVDSFPIIIGKDGDPQKLAEARTKAYYPTRKIARISTPLIKGVSRIEAGYLRGDQRKFQVPCKKCNGMQSLVFQWNDDKVRHGLVWDTNEGRLVQESVRYLCKFCGEPHTNSDKSWMLPAGKWVPTASSSDKYHRSYHISAMYSPIGMLPWEAIVQDWLDAWDTDNNKPKNIGRLQEFYNNNLGKPFEEYGEKISRNAVSLHKRACYTSGNIPNEYAKKYSGSRILFVTCQIDVQKTFLSVATMGWTRDAKCYLIECLDIKPSDDKGCDEIGSSVWIELQSFLEEKLYTADDGTTYNIVMTLIDANWATDTVTNFCAQYAQGIFPIVGRSVVGNTQVKEFGEYKTQAGQVGYRILVDHYKDRIAPVLRREWYEEVGPQRRYHFNAPFDLPQKKLNELTVEYKKQKRDQRGRLIWEWYRPGNARNELWDLLVYGHAAVDIMAWMICIRDFGLDTIDWAQFWDYIESSSIYYNEKNSNG
jgi:phage terminase large subunit GpA-like protein